MDFDNDLFFEADHGISSQSSLEADNSMSEQQKTGMVLFFAVTILSVLFVSICSVRQYFKNCSSTTNSCCARFFTRESRVIRESEQYFEDRIFAETLQRRLNEEERERERIAKRKERRMWYEYYMKPWTMVVSQSDLFYADKEDSAFGKGDHTCRKDEDVSTLHVHMKGKTNESKDVLMDSDIEEVSDDVERREANQLCTCDEDDENATMCLHLPLSGRCIDGTCAFCLEEYKTGDKVVWSGLECQHAFHKDCLMQWLSKGKKRCPICRHWFVPGSKIDDQKVTHGEAWRIAFSDMQQSEREKKEFESLSHLEQGTVDVANVLPSTQTTINSTTSESHQRKVENNVLECTASYSDYGNSEYLVVQESNDIESHEMESPKENTTGSDKQQ